jgi:hypothetical protein
MINSKIKLDVGGGGKVEGSSTEPNALRLAVLLRPVSIKILQKLWPICIQPWL